jgi:hypothetical protein
MNSPHLKQAKDLLNQLIKEQTREDLRSDRLARAAMEALNLSCDEARGPGSKSFMSEHLENLQELLNLID